MYMRKIKWFLIIIIVTVISSAFGQSGGTYKLEWSTIDGGGSQSVGGDYVLIATAGQPEAGASSGGDYELLGGFWPGGLLCIVEFEDFSRFAEYWLETGTGLPADLYEDENNIVDWLDLGAFVNEWLYYCPYDWPLK